MNYKTAKNGGFKEYARYGYCVIKKRFISQQNV